MKEQLAKQYTEHLVQRKKCCFCLCNLQAAVGYIACYVKIRAFVLVAMSFIPPLIQIDYKKSWRYPEGRRVIKPYLENSELMLLYTMNILIGSLLLCYGVASYYTWSVTQAELLEKNRIDVANYNRLPRTHLVFMLYLLMLALI